MSGAVCNDISRHMASGPRHNIYIGLLMIFSLLIIFAAAWFCSLFFNSLDSRNDKRD